MKTLPTCLKRTVVAAAACGFAALPARVLADSPTPTFVWSPAATDSSAASGGAQDSSANGVWNTGIAMGGGYIRRAPNGSGYVFDLKNTPYTSVDALQTGTLSVSLYGDANRMDDSGKRVLAMFGATYGGSAMLVMFREGANIKAAVYDSSCAVVGTEASVAAPAGDEVHLYTMTFDKAAGSIGLYIDGGDVSATASGAYSDLTFNRGMQLGSLFGGNGSTGFSTGAGFAMVTALGFESALSAAEVAALAEDYPSYASAAGTLASTIDPAIGNGYTLTLYDAAATTDEMYLGLASGTLAIAEGSTVTVPAMRVLNTSDGGASATLDVGGTLVVTSTSTDPCVWNDRTAYKGILWGHWYGTGTYNITGSLLATNAYVETDHDSAVKTQTINVHDGGYMKVRGFYSHRGGKGVVNLYGGGTLEVAEILSDGGAITKNFGDGTFRTVADVTETREVNFCAEAGSATTLDPTSRTLTFAAGAVAGSGDIAVRPSEAGGKVVFEGLEGYSGVVTVEAGSAEYTLSSVEDDIGGTLARIVTTGGTLTIKASDGSSIDQSRVTTETSGGVTTYAVAAAGNTWRKDVDGYLGNAENWSWGRLPNDGENFRIEISDDTEINVNCELFGNVASVVGTEGKTATFVDVNGALTATNLLVCVDVVVGGSNFQPMNVTVSGDASVRIGEGGVLTNALFTYEGALPTAGEAFTTNAVASAVTSADRWGGTVYLKNMAVTDFRPGTYGNASSVVRVSGVSGWLGAPSDAKFVNDVALELSDDAGVALTLNNGNSANSLNTRRCTYFSRLAGDGTLQASGSASTVVVVFGDASEFAGAIQLSNKMVVIGDDMPDYSEVVAGRIFVAEGKTLPVVAGTSDARATWAVGGIVVEGTVTTPNLDYFGIGTTNVVRDAGVFEITGRHNNDDKNVDFGRVTGTGTLRVVSAGWWGVSRNNFPTTMVLDNQAANGIIVSVANVTNMVGSLSGSNYVRSDLQTGTRDMGIVQSVDTTWSGTFKADVPDRLDTVHVFPGADGRAGVLTLTGAQAQSNDLAVATGAGVKIEGAWVGNVTASGTLGGSGSVAGDGALDDATILSTGSTGTALVFSGALSVSGETAIRLPEGYDVAAGNGQLVIRAEGGVAASGATYRVFVGDEEVSSKACVVEVGSTGLRLRSRSYSKVPFRIMLR